MIFNAPLKFETNSARLRLQTIDNRARYFMINGGTRADFRARALAICVLATVL